MPRREDWLPYGLDERKRAFQQIADGAETYAADLGLTAAEVDRIKAIAVEYAFAVDIFERNRVNMRALRSWRDAVISNKRSIKPVSERPMFDNTPMPVRTQAGLVAEMRKYVRRIKSASGYREGMGIGMKILSPNHVKKPLRDLAPKLKVTALGGFKVRIACQMEGMSALQIEFKRNGEERFEKVAFLTSLPEVIYIEPRVMGVPETGVMRAIFIKRNEPVGNYSNTPPITIFGA
ncbi:MAG: hypothetical protein IPI64_09990 [Chloracidobacterium sp.]|nr:hypothetical protein [Chloracidobacterium sp.]